MAEYVVMAELVEMLLDEDIVLCSANESRSVDCWCPF
jgi:hypothetical protein